MKVIFLGTPSFAVPTLEALADSGFEIPAVVCRADKPAGRGMKAVQPPVKRFAESRGLPVFQPLKMRDPDFKAAMKKLKPDVLIVVAYGLIVPRWVLELAPAGCINVHGSLLPLLRGAAPIQRAILEGFEVTGISIMKLDKGMDTGPVFHRTEMAIHPGETASELHDRMSRLSAEVLPKVLPSIVSGELQAQAQDDSQATYADKITPEMECIDWAEPAQVVDRVVRCMSPRPGAFSLLRDRRLKILATRPLPDEPAGAGPGVILPLKQPDRKERRLAVACGQGVLELLEVQPEGKRRMSWVDFLAGYRIAGGEKLVGPC